jgi:serine/threonine protein phosphatase PrpC
VVEDIAGVFVSQGQRDYQEDRYAMRAIKLPVGERGRGGEGMRQMYHRYIYLYGVFDGHAGHRASEFASKVLPELMAEQCARYPEMSFDSGRREEVVANGKILGERLHRSFLGCHDAWMDVAERNAWQDGSTASVLLVDLDHGHLVSGQLGDSRAILCREGRAVALTPEHVPMIREERERVEEAGGSVVVGTDSVARLEGMLCVTRAFGDLAMRQFGLSAEPTISTRALKLDLDSFAIVASDGLFGDISPQEACDLVKHCRFPADAAQLLGDAAQSAGSEDNTAIVVVPLPAWGRHADTDYTALMRHLKLDKVFGSGPTLLPKSLHRRIQQRVASPEGIDQAGLIHDLWKLFDLDDDGALLPSEIDHGMQQLGHHLSADELDTLVALASTCPSGRVTLDDFVRQFDDDHYR